ncbi:MAG: hypothetical protein HDQ90_00910 [Desulfovibrio sp.]|nr:hypothetical protein [Desulfovibrio sp.]
MSGWIEKVEFKKISPGAPCGFEGFLPLKGLAESKCAEIPEKPGVYLILTPSTQMPGFNADNPTFKEGKLQPRTVEALQKQWNASTHILYIGKAGGADNDSNLKKRLNQYFTWFFGKGSGHDGGRDIWQIDHPGELLVAWRVTEDKDPESCEKALLDKFTAEFKKLPFANHRH